jgi:polyferredoxin
MNLLNVRWIHSLLSSRWFPIAAQLIMLAAFGLSIAGGIRVTTDDAGFAKELRNTNLANLVIWSFWWPLIIIAAILLGRVWCMVCPMELITSVAGRMGLRRKVPDLLKSGWVITIFYTLILIVGVHTLALHRLPQRMALYLLMLLVVALAVGLIYEKRAFCSYVCPVGHMLGLYAFISPFEWGANVLSVCGSCKTKDCIAKKNHYRIVGRSCTSNLYPATIKDNQDCLLCTQCLKVCPYDNLRLSTRWPFADFFRAVELRAAQVGFVLLVSGFVVYEVLSEWPVSKAILKWIPEHLVDTLGITGPMTGFVSAIVMFIIFPGVLFLAVGALAKIASGGKVSSGVVVKTFALLLLPTMAGAHLIKSMLKMTSRIPYWPHAFSDPKGVATAQEIVDKTLVLDKSVTDALYPAISFAAAVVLLTALVATLLIFRRSTAVQKLNPGARVIVILGVLAYWGVFGFMIFKWRFC